MLNQSKVSDTLMNSLQNRVNQALNNPISTRCADLTVLIDEYSSKDLQAIYPGLIESIFGTAGSVSWGLRNILSNKTPNDFTTLHQFLGPVGPLFRLIYKLLTETQVKYEYLAIYLPEKIRHNLENNKIPPFYTDLLNFETQSRKLHSLLLNSFDFYMFHFAYYLINPFQQYSVSQEWSVWNTIYYVLSCDYMLHFLPTDPNYVILPQLINYTGKNPTIIPPPSITNRPQNTSKLFRNNFLEQTAPDISTLHQPMQYHPRGEIWRSEAIIQIFIDIWLNSNLVMNSDISFTFQYDNKASRLPNGEYIRITRVFIKQLHAFANSARHDTTALGELKRIVHSMIQGPMYAFIRHLVHRWPTDGSFRLVLELWLSFIQPWRYSGDLMKYYENEIEDLNVAPIRVVDQHSINFIADNLLAYTVILQQLIPRFARIDMSSPKLSLMVFRIFKVFNQPNLVSMIREIESCVESLNHSPTHTYSSQATILPPLSPTSSWSTNTNCNSSLSSFNSSNNSLKNNNDSITFSSPRNNLITNKWAAIVRHRIYEWEGPEFCYKPMFTGKAAPEVYQLLKQVINAEQAAKDIVSQRMTESQIQYGNFFIYFFKTLIQREDFVYDEFSLEERMRIPMLLSTTRSNIIDMFRIDMKDIPEVHYNHSARHNFSILSSPFQADMTPNTAKNRGKRIKYQGDPDLHPIRTNECAILVRILYQASQKINDTFPLQLRDLYYNQGLVGKLSRQILQEPIQTYFYEKSSPGYSPRIRRILPPRISLRFFASHLFIAYVGIGFFLAKLFDFGLFPYLLSIFFIWFTIICFRAYINDYNPDLHTTDYFTDSIHDLSY